MNRYNYNRYAQLLVVLLCAFALKMYYSTATPNQLRWILAPTSFIVELITDTSFQFESHAGYLSDDHTFLIAASCAGVNFLITAFLMLSLRRLWRDRAPNLSWSFVPVAGVVAYLATLVANAARISIALRMHDSASTNGWMSPNQLHRFEGIFVYFGFLLLLYVIDEKVSSANRSSLFRLPVFPLVMYYATTLGIPLVNGGYRQGTAFLEHSLFVLLIPLSLILLIIMFRFCGRIHRRALAQFRPQPNGARSVMESVP